MPQESCFLLGFLSRAWSQTLLATEPALPRGKPTGGYDHITFACGSGSTIVAGRVVYTDRAGIIRPLHGVRFILSTHGTVHCSPEPARVRVRQDKEGRFSFPVTLWSDSIGYFQGERQVAWDDVEDTATVTLNARGCNDLTIQVDDQWKERDLEMACSKR